MGVVFVSSTFRDMHYERDAIRDIVAPEVNKVARCYGQYVSFVDLRWGVDTQGIDEASEHLKEERVLDVCLDEIDRSGPPIIAILGDRYGWMPGMDGQRVREADEREAHLIGDAAARKDGFVLEDDLISVTALEVEYGALRDRKQLENALFYYRAIEGSCEGSVYAAEGGLYSEKRALLHRRIEKLNGMCETFGGRASRRYTVRFEDGMPHPEDIGAFARMVAEDVLNILEPSWERQLAMTPLQRSLELHRHLMADKAGLLQARKAELDRYVDMLRSGPGIHLVLKGEPGSGKTTLLAAIASKLASLGNDPVLFISCGFTPDSADSAGVLRLIVEWLSSLCGKQHSDGADVKGVSDLIDEMESLCSNCAQAGVLPIIVIDAIDQLSPDENRDRLAFLPRSEAVCYIVSCTSQFNVGDRACERLDPITDCGERLAIIHSLEASGVHKEIGGQAREYLLSLPASENPLFLSLAMQTLVMLDRRDFGEIDERVDGGVAADEAINGYLAEVLEKRPASTAEMGAYLIVDAIDHTGAEREPMRRALEYLAVSRRGLRVEDLERLQDMHAGERSFGHFDALGFAALRSYFSNCFIQRADSRFDFTHNSFREGIVSAIPSGRKPHVHADILKALRSCDEDDPVRIEEEAYHAYWARDAESLWACVCACEKQTKAAAESGEAKAGAIVERRRWVLSRDMRECCEDDEERWLADQIGKTCERPAGEAVIDFINGCVYSSAVVGKLGLSKLRVAKTVLAGMLTLASGFHEDLDDASSRERLASTSYSLAYVLDCMGDLEFGRSLVLYWEAYKLRRSNREENPDQYARSCDNLASSLRNAAEGGIDIDPALLASEDGGSVLSLQERIVGLFEEEIDIRERLCRQAELDMREDANERAEQRLQAARENLAWAYSNMAMKGLACGLPDRPADHAGRSSEELYEIALKLREAVLEEGRKSPEDIEKVAYTELGLARRLREKGDGKSLERANELAEDACSKRELVFDATGSPKAARALAEAFGDRADVLASFGEWRLAVQYREKALACIRRTVHALATPQCKLDLVISALNLADALERCSEPDDAAGMPHTGAELRRCMLLSEASGWLESMYVDNPRKGSPEHELLSNCYGRLMKACRSSASEAVPEIERRRGLLGGG